MSSESTNAASATPPKKTVLVSFLGVGTYISTPYFFADRPDDVYVCELPALALYRHLRRCGRPIDTWVILGTRESKWTQVSEMIPEGDREELPPVSVGDSDHLALLGESLTRRMDCEVSLRVVPYGENAAEQAGVARILIEALSGASDLVFDVTNGLRSQPIVTSFVLGYLRRFQPIDSIQMHYAAFDLRPKNNDRAPFHDVSMCMELLEYTEALHTHEVTGAIEPLASKLPEPAKANVQNFAFAVGTNRTESVDIKREAAVQALAATEGHDSPWHETLREKIIAFIGDVKDDRRSVGNSMLDRGMQALKYGDYVVALTVLWEGACQFVVDEAKNTGKKRLTKLLRSLYRNPPRETVKVFDSEETTESRTAFLPPKDFGAGKAREKAKNLLLSDNNVFNGGEFGNMSLCKAVYGLRNLVAHAREAGADLKEEEREVERVLVERYLDRQEDFADLLKTFHTHITKSLPAAIKDWKDQTPDHPA